MTTTIRRFARLFCCLLMLGVAARAADPAKTLIVDTLYRADGTPATGTLVISWPAFISADGKPVAAGSLNVKVRDGAVSIPLVPTQGATPAGTYYKVVVTLDGGAGSQEYWSVPTLSPANIASIRSSVVPATVAMQVVSREYVDGAIAAAFGTGGEPLALSRGGTGQNSWTSARCVRVANDGTSLESASADCNVGDAVTIKGKAVDTPSASGEQLTYNGTKFIAQPKQVIDVRDLAGVDCTGATPSDAALNALFQRADYSLWGKTVSLRNCTVRLDNQLLIRGQSAVSIDLTGAFLFGCNGAAGPLVLLQRSGYITIDGGRSGKIWAYGGSSCGGAGSSFTGSIGTANTVGAGGTEVTTTANTFRRLNLAPNSNAAITNYCAICTTTEENQEAYLIEENTLHGNGSQNSIGIGLLSGNAQSLGILRNSIIGFMWGVKLISPYNNVEGNQFGANGDWDTFTPTTIYGGSTSGAAIFCTSSGNVIKFNNTFEGSGMFLWGRSDGGNSGCGATVEDNMFGPDHILVNSIYSTSGLHGGHHAPPDAYVIDSGNTGNLYLKHNIAWNCSAYTSGQCVPNTRPIVGTSAAGADNVGGSQARYIDDGNTWQTTAFDAKPPVGGFESLAPGRATQRISTSDEVLETLGTFYYTNPPRKEWFAGSPANTPSGTSDVWGAGVVDDNQNNRSSFHIDQLRNDFASAGTVEIAKPLVGGITTQAAAAMLGAQALAQGGGSGNTWGYKLCGKSGGGTVSCTSEFTVSSAAALDGTYWNKIQFIKPADYYAVQLWLTTQPGGAGRTLGMIAQYTTLNASSSCDVALVQGCESSHMVYFQDKGQATITAGSPPATTADGTIKSAGFMDAASGFKINGSAGANGQCIVSDGAASAWGACGGSGGTPGGADTQVQFNDAGSFGGDSNFVWDKINHRLGLGAASNPRYGVINSLASGTVAFGAISSTDYRAGFEFGESTSAGGGLYWRTGTTPHRVDITTNSGSNPIAFVQSGKNGIFVDTVSNNARLCFGCLAPVSGKTVTVQDTNINATTLLVKAGSSQSGSSLQEWADNSGAVLAAVGSDGKLTTPALTLSTLAAPTCDASHRGQFNYVAGGAGVKDIVQVCTKDAADAYAWRTIY